MGPHDAKLESLRKVFYQRRPHMNYARIVHKVREQIIKFSGEPQFILPLAIIYEIIQELNF